MKVGRVPRCWGQGETDRDISGGPRSFRGVRSHNDDHQVAFPQVPAAGWQTGGWGAALSGGLGMRPSRRAVMQRSGRQEPQRQQTVEGGLTGGLGPGTPVLRVLASAPASKPDRRES